MLATCFLLSVERERGIGVKKQHEEFRGGRDENLLDLQQNTLPILRQQHLDGLLRRAELRSGH